MVSVPAPPNHADVPPRDAANMQLSWRPLDEGDRDRIVKWMQNPLLTATTVVVPSPQHSPTFDETAAQRYVDELLYDPSRKVWAVCTGGVHIGNVGLREYDRARHTSECFVELGDARWRGRGIGCWAMQALIHTAFHELDIVELTLGVFDFNDVATRLYAKLGFTPFGTYGWHWADGRYHRIVHMRLQREWGAPRTR